MSVKRRVSSGVATFYFFSAFSECLDGAEWPGGRKVAT